MKHSLAAILSTFFHQYLAVELGRSDNTIQSYLKAITLLLRFLESHLKKSADDILVEDIDQQQILAFLDHYEKEKGWSARTRNQRLAAIKALFLFISREHPDLALQAQRVRSIGTKATETSPPQYLEEDELKAILDAIDQDAPNGVRDYVILLLAYNTGARVSELIEIKIDDLRLDSSGQVKILGKGRKQRSCPLWPETVEVIKRLIQIRRPKDLDEQHHPLWRPLHLQKIRTTGRRRMPFHQDQNHHSPHHAPHHGHAPHPRGQRHQYRQLLARTRPSKYHPHLRRNRHADETKDARKNTTTKNHTAQNLASDRHHRNARQSLS
jgi:site-specific recombinase XerD